MKCHDWTAKEEQRTFVDGKTYEDCSDCAIWVSFTYRDTLHKFELSLKVVIYVWLGIGNGNVGWDVECIYPALIVFTLNKSYYIRIDVWIDISHEIHDGNFSDHLVQDLNCSR